jgi:hypothetical protein
MPVFAIRHAKYAVATSVVVLFVLFLAFAFQVLGQGISGSIAGTVVDPSSLPIPGASVVVTNTGTGAQWRTLSDERGAFEFLSLLPGTFDIEVELTGFKRLLSAGHRLLASQRLSVGLLALEIGEFSESITVSGNIGTVQAISGERAANVTRLQLQNLPSLSRDPLEQWARLPGVVSDGAANSPIHRPVTLRDMNVMGGRRNNKNFTLDGVSALNTQNNQEASVTPDTDAVEEVQVMLSNHQAEYGRSSGATINLVTRSGTRDFHGSVYFYRRHESLNANGFFNNLYGRAKTPNRGQTRGLTIGGPIYIPGVFNTDRRKLFFFFGESQQPTKFPPSLWQYTVPTELERRGDFSQSFDQTGKLIAIKDPVTGAPFPGNVIPADRLNEFGTQLLKVFPLPANADPLRRWNYQTSGLVFEIPRRSEVLKIDYHLNDDFVLTGRYAQDRNDNVNWSPAAFKLGPHRLSRPGKNFSLRLNQVYSSNLINESGIGYNRLRLDQDVEGEEGLLALQREARGVELGQFTPENNPHGLLPDVTFGAVMSGVAAANIGIALLGERNFQRQFSFMDNLSWIRNRHIFKFGLYVERGDSTLFPGGGNGAINFSVDANNPNDSGHPFANAALGNFRTYTEPVTRLGERNFRFWNIEWYGQDTWRLSPKLTLEYGLRLYLHPHEKEINGFSSSFDLSLFDPAKKVRLYQPFRNEQGVIVGRDPITGQTVPSNQVGAIVPGSGDPANGFRLGGQGDLVADRGIHYAPRIGFAFDPSGRGNTAIRGGFGVFYDRTATLIVSRLSDNPPLFMMPTVFNGNLNSLLGATGAAFPQAVRGISDEGHLSTTMNFSLGVQRRVFSLFVLDVSYVGSLSRHMPEARDYNALPAAARFLASNEDPSRPGRALADPFLRPYQGYNQILITEMTSNANYNSMQLALRRTFGSRINFDVNYTWARALNYVSGDDGVRSRLLGGKRDYGRSDLAANHSVNGNMIVAIPDLSQWLNRNRYLAAVLDGWQMTMTAQIQSGYPQVVSLQAPGLDFTGSTEGARVNLTGNPNLPKSERAFSRHFDTSVFAMPKAGAFGITLPGDVDFGNASKDVFNQPGFNMWNASLSKVFRLYENHQLQVSGEFYNFPNHTQFRRADNVARFNAAGVQTNTRFGEYISGYGARQVQLGLRYSF